MNSKIEAYIGFAIKKGSVAFGCDAIEKCRKRVYLLLVTADISENSRKKVNVCAEKFHCEVVQTENYDVLSKRNCKALAICDKSLAEAILSVK